MLATVEEQGSKGSPVGYRTGNSEQGTGVQSLKGPNPAEVEAGAWALTAAAGARLPGETQVPRSV